jgi:uncharacterized delta-60 repeat protein
MKYKASFVSSLFDLTRFVAAICTGRKPRRMMPVCLAALMALALISPPLLASEGDLDPSFGTSGKLTTDFFNHLDRATAVAIQPDGRVIVAGRSAAGSNLDDITQGDFAILRYNPDGSLDNSFGVEGKVTTSFLGFPASANAVALYPDGKIVAAGYVEYDKDEDANIGVVRYNPDGSLDTSFDNDGKVITGFFGIEDIFNDANAVAVQPDGKIIVGGFAVRTLNETGAEFGLVRYNEDGSLDNSFGTNGKTVTDFFGSSDFAMAMALQPDGKIVLAGDIVNFPANTNHDFGLARYNSDGSLDTGFGSGGKVATDFFHSSDVAQAIALQPDGKIIVGGYVYGGSNDYDFGLARYNPDGSLDTSFGKSGKVTTDIAGARDEIFSLTLQPDRKIIAGGFATVDSSKSLVALARYNRDGGLDSSFGVNGKITSDFFGLHNTAHALAMQPDGRLVVAGEAQKAVNDYDIALLRYFAFTPPDFTLSFDSPTHQGSRGVKRKVSLNINRLGGFNGNVTISVSDTNDFGIVVIPNPVSTTESKIKFKIKVKGSAPVGTRQITFTGRDDSGRERSVTLSEVVQ